MNAIINLQSLLGADVIHGPGEADFSRHTGDFLSTMAADIQLLGAAYPRTTEEVSAILKACNAAGIPVTPQGGMTGLAGGGVPAVPSLVLSLERMRAIEEIDTAASTMTVQAGVVLETVQKAAEEADLFFPLDLGGRGSARIGGNAATNAGGNRVLRYGMMRELVLGVEAVLADGTIVTSLNKMLKNNAGYDTKQLFIGSEGTLGVITRLVLRLFPKPRSVNTGLVAVKDFAAVLELLKHCKAGLGPNLSAFETMWPVFYHIGTTELGRTPPIPHGHGVYVLIETLGTDPESDQTRFEETIAGAIEAGVVEDAVVAKSQKESTDLWNIRDCPGEFTKVFWPQMSFDVSMSTGDIGAAMEDIEKRLKTRWPEMRTVFFGHIADSNLHLSVKLGEGAMPEHDIEEEVYRAVGDWKGSISAEHGIGTIKRPFLHYSRSPAELALMRTLKTALDPKGILNPGKVI